MAGHEVEVGLSGAGDDDGVEDIEHGQEDEDDGDEKPQVVVLKEGKHLTEREAENERRKGTDPHALCPYILS